MKTVKEGLVSLRIPDSKKEVFYNPEMELSRDISVAFLQALGIKNAVVCDLLSAAGARAIRYAKETGAAKVYANDVSENAVNYIKENSKANGADNKIVTSCSGANAFLASYKKYFDFIDIDPFGSPVYFLDELAKAAKPNSYLAVTATDCGALAGVFPKTCAERYGIKLERTECFKEVGVRNLIGVLTASLGKQKLFVSPLLSHVTKHYFRIFLKISDKGEKLLGNFYHCSNCGYCTFDRVAKCEVCKSPTSKLGPIWSGNLYDKDVCFKILDALKLPQFKKSGRARKIILSLIGEMEQPFYYDIHKIAGRLSNNTPGIEFVMDELKKSGFISSRTQFSDTSIKTDAKIGDIISIIGISDKLQRSKRTV
ncbi:MAG: tRNA (guanine(10)-N(2))-dimethyltransferase [Candidatus Aenigmarchaeota archaeon]|nr:tRNA (guanine(10)-N(2))-dimethyltransferase [Candidatus Aenigmarchaeota archaeon]